MSKFYLSSNDETLIPRLEFLLDAPVSVKLNVTLNNELNLLLRPIFWTDLTIVLPSIANDWK